MKLQLCLLTITQSVSEGSSRPWAQQPVIVLFNSVVQDPGYKLHLSRLLNLETSFILCCEAVL